LQLEASLGKSVRHYLKSKLKAKGLGADQEVEHKLSKCEATSSTPKTAKK
jgi:hypothetical protein